MEGFILERSEKRAKLQLVVDFCQSWAAGDLELLMSFLAEDAEWENVPTGCVIGRAAIRERLAPIFSRVQKIEWLLLHAAVSDDGTVLTERVDQIHVGGRRVDLRLMGIFQVREAKIVLWRDYFENTNYRQEMDAAGA